MWRVLVVLVSWFFFLKWVVVVSKLFLMSLVFLCVWDGKGIVVGLFVIIFILVDLKLNCSCFLVLIKFLFWCNNILCFLMSMDSCFNGWLILGIILYSLVSLFLIVLGDVFEVISLVIWCVYVIFWKLKYGKWWIFCIGVIRLWWC